MAAIITENFRYENANIFKTDVESGSDKYWLFIGKATPFSVANDGTGASDSAPPTTYDEVANNSYYWDDMLAAKHIASTDVAFVVPRRNWTASARYDMYEHNVSGTNLTYSGVNNIYSSTFYFMTTEYKVYKVLHNGNTGEGSAAAVYSGGVAPAFTDNSPQFHGGYLLQYVCTISTGDVEKFLTTDFMPIKTNSTVAAAQSTMGTGRIQSLLVTPGTGYNNGTFYTPIQGDGTNAGTADGAIVKVITSGNSITAFSSGGTNMHDNLLTKRGGYTYGTINLNNCFSNATLATPATIHSSPPVNAIIPIIDPKGGHGSNAPKELGAHYVMSNTTLSGAEGSGDFNTVNDFRRVGIVKSPFDYGTTNISATGTKRQTYCVNFASSSNNFTVDEEIRQASTGAIGRVVRWDAANKNLYYQQERHNLYGTNDGTYLTGKKGSYKAFSGTNTITGQTSSPTPTGTPSTTTGAVGGVTFASGYATPEMAFDSGDILYIENRKPIYRATDQTEDVKIIVEF